MRLASNVYTNANTPTVGPQSENENENFSPELRAGFIGGIVGPSNRGTFSGASLVVGAIATIASVAKEMFS